MSKSAIRYQRLIGNLDKYNSVTEAMKASGFSDTTSEKQQKRVLRSALKWKADNTIEEAKILAGDTTVGSKKLMHEILGISRDSLTNRLKSIAEQEKDLASALKVLIPLAKQLGVDLTQEQQGATIVPTLNVTVRETKDGSTKPFIETTAQPVAEGSLDDNVGDEE